MPQPPRELDAFDERNALTPISRQPAESLWLQEDTQAVLDYLREKALTCPGCGLPRDETMDPEAERHYRARALRCHACAAREREAKRFTSGPHDAGGLFFVTDRVNRS